MYNILFLKPTVKREAPRDGQLHHSVLFSVILGVVTHMEDSACLDNAVSTSEAQTNEQSGSV